MDVNKGKRYSSIAKSSKPHWLLFIPSLSYSMQLIDFIIDNTPRSELGLSLEKWKRVWPALIRVLREIDLLSHPDEIFDKEEPAPEEALELPIATTTQKEK